MTEKLLVFQTDSFIDTIEQSNFLQRLNPDKPRFLIIENCGEVNLLYCTSAALARRIAKGLGIHKVWKPDEIKGHLERLTQRDFPEKINEEFYDSFRINPLGASESISEPGSDAAKLIDSIGICDVILYDKINLKLFGIQIPVEEILNYTQSI